MKVADFVIQYLRDTGIKKVFVVYGAANGDLIDAFPRIDEIDYVAVMHEQAGAFMAEGYAKVTGELACVIVTSGPGGQNLLTGIANCYYDSVPVLFITGQVNSQFMRESDAIRQLGFQETPIHEIVKPITKWSKLVRTIHDVKWCLECAVRLAVEDRQGPVLLDIPIDVQKGEIGDY